MNIKPDIQHFNRRKYLSNPYKATALIAIAVLFFALSFNSGAQSAASAVKDFNLEKGVAISGYDAVAYFTSGKALPGKSTISYSHNGALYYFANEADRQLFIKDPAKYEPQYGGWCAYAMATKGEKVEIDPQTFKIVNGKLLLFYNKFFNNTLTSWNKNEKNLLPQADSNWAHITKK